MPKVGYGPTEPIRSSANGCQVYAFPPQGLHSKSYQGRTHTCIARGVLFSLPGGIHQSAAGFLSASGISAYSFRRPEIFNSGPPWIRTRPVRLSPGSIDLSFDLSGIHPRVTQNPSVFEAHEELLPSAPRPRDWRCLLYPCPITKIGNVAGCSSMPHEYLLTIGPRCSCSAVPGYYLSPYCYFWAISE